MEVVLKINKFLNNTYNDWFIKSRQICDAESVAVDKLAPESPSSKNAHLYQCVWLLNLKKVVLASKVDTKQFHFMDVGCGKGVSTIYANEKFKWGKISGFDFDSKLIGIAQNNAKNQSTSVNIDFFCNDASTIVLPDEKLFLFLFCPFNEIVLRQFLENNIEKLKKNKSIIGYVNSHFMDVVKDFLPSEIVEVSRKHRLTVVRF